MWKDFREFVMRGSVVDLAVGVIVGAAFGRITTSLVDDVLMPPIGLLLGRVDFSNLFFVLGEGTFATIADARKAGVPVIAYGTFINTIINFVIIAFAVFLLVRQVNRLRRSEPPPPAAPAPEVVLLTEIRDTLRARG